MKNMPKFVFITLAILLVGVLAIPFVHGQSTGTDQGQSTTQGPGPGPHWGHRRFGGRLFSQLNLTDAQKAQMKQLHQAFRQNTQALRQEIMAKRMALRQAQQGDTFNEALATQTLTEIAPLQAQLMSAQYKLRQQIEAVLTTEQKAQLEQMRAQMKAKREQFMNKQAAPNANSQ